MKRLALLLTALGIATTAHANGITGNVLKTNGQPVWPCNIDIVNRQTNQPVIIAGDTTLPNGHYNLVLPDGRYNLTFKPVIGTHTFQGLFNDARVQGNTVTVNQSLPTGSYFKGKVVSTTGTGIPFTDIRFKDAFGNLIGTVQDNGTNADGTFNTLVVPGTYTAEIVPAITNHKVPIEMLSQNLNVDINLGNVVVPDGFILTCTVTDASQFPITGARIIARNPLNQTRFFTPTNNTSGTGVAQVVLPPGAWNVIADPPPGFETSLATATQYSWNVSADATLPNFALLAAKLITGKLVGGSPSGAVVNADIDIDKMIAPTFPRVETLNDFTDGLGNYTQAVVSGLYRVTFNPPVATKLLSLRIDNVNVGAGNLNMGTLTAKQGHWIDVTVLAQGTGVPIAGANIDLVNIRTHQNLITIDDVTLANGTTRIVSDDSLYTFRVSPPNANYDTAYVAGKFRTLTDTAVTIIMPRKGVLGVGAPKLSALQLADPWPNPARGNVRFSFAGQGEGELTIVDVSGRRVATPWHGTLAGEASAGWGARDDAGRAVPSGVYFAILRVDGGRSVRRVVVAN
jgi:hypothetical protein